MAPNIDAMETVPKDMHPYSEELSNEKFDRLIR